MRWNAGPNTHKTKKKTRFKGRGAKKAIITIKANGTAYPFIGEVRTDDGQKTVKVLKALKPAHTRVTKESLKIEIYGESKGLWHRFKRSLRNPFTDRNIHDTSVYVSTDSHVIDSVYSTIRENSNVVITDYKISYQRSRLKNIGVLRMEGGEDVPGGRGPIPPEA